MHDPRGKTGVALSYALSPTGADHSTTIWWAGTRWISFLLTVFRQIWFQPLKAVNGWCFTHLLAEDSGINAKLFLHRGTGEGWLRKKEHANIERPTSNVEWEKIKKQK